MRRVSGVNGLCTENGLEWSSFIIPSNGDEAEWVSKNERSIEGNQIDENDEFIWYTLGVGELSRTLELQLQT